MLPGDRLWDIILGEDEDDDPDFWVIRPEHHPTGKTKGTDAEYCIYPVI